MKNKKGKLTSSKSFGFSVREGAFSKVQSRDQLTDKKRDLDKRINLTNDVVGVLDRYDDFASLKINTAYYGQSKGSGAYGIAPKENNESVIYDHQEKAAREFLRDLRGFGLLADVVGSGKTYEAGVILSELAVQGKIQSMLVIVPEQVYGAWIKVLEKDFGLGKDVLFRANMECRACKTKIEQTSDDYEDNSGKTTSPKVCPKCGASLAFENNIPPLRDKTKKPLLPVIVKMEDFATWSDSTADLLFDVIVVDEAHNLCQQDGVYAKAMKLLSKLMDTKKKANSTFCMLLTATPHSGNLDNMFRLWYFVRCQGGNPADFDLKEEKRSDEYQTEKKYYFEHVCHKSTTVMEFIQNVKQEVIVNPQGQFIDAFTEYLLSEQKGITVAEFLSMNQGERRGIVDDFLRNKERRELRRAVYKRIADEYHNGLLRSIMIRGSAKIGKQKNVKNLYFYHTNKTGVITLDGIVEKKPIKVNLDDLSAPDAIECEGEKFSVDGYVEAYKGNAEFDHAKAELLISRIFNHTHDEKYFTKQNYNGYYQSQFTENFDATTDNMIVPVGEEESELDHKIKETKKIIERHKNKRVLIFFDYELKKDKLVFDKVEEILSQDPSLKKRILVGTPYNKKSVVEKFHEKDDAILIIKDSAFTEGVNLQVCNVIINFQVSPDPLSMDQRVGRIFRLGQKNDVYIYSLVDMHELEGYALAYYARIALISSSSGDATIIAGSNNECMRTVRCRTCGHVELLTQEEYELRKKKDDLYCHTTERCREASEKGSLMQEICVYDFKCDTCGRTFTRSVSREGYQCISINNDEKGIMCSSGVPGDRSMYCRKICAMAHCSFFTSPSMKGKCKAINAYRRNPDVSDEDLMSVCDDCNNPNCRDRCRVDSFADAISSCGDCQYATCSPKPYKLDFNDKWEAECPNCASHDKEGTIRPVVARTFATFLRSLWDFNYDGGSSFCEKLGKEADKVSEIKRILTLDNKE